MVESMRYERFVISAWRDLSHKYSPHRQGVSCSDRKKAAEAGITGSRTFYANFNIHCSDSDLPAATPGPTGRGSESAGGRELSRRRHVVPLLRVRASCQCSETRISDTNSL